MSAGLNVGTYAAVNMLIEFGPANVTLAHDGVLLGHVVNVYESNCRLPGPPPEEIGGGVFSAPQTLALSCRLRRKPWTPVAPTRPGAEAGARPSRFFVVVKVECPIGT